MIARASTNHGVASVLATPPLELPVPFHSEFLSPSLTSPLMPGDPRTSSPAHEVKFLLTEQEARQIESDLKPRMFVDPHAAAREGEGAYATTTSYCDTPDFDVYHRRGSFARRKYRIRRYGLDELCFLERKTKQGTRVQKRRSPITLDALDRMNDVPLADCWEGDWFHRRIATRGLRPVLTIMYDRTAYFRQSDEGMLRLTFDRNIRGQTTANWQVTPFSGGTPVLSESVVCEFKFRGAMPSLFKQVVEARRLSPTSVSKYRLCWEAIGFATLSGSPHA